LSIWDTYPADYRWREIQTITKAVQAGECAAVVGLSGSGKSNLVGFLAHRVPGRGDKHAHPAYVLVDCNRLGDPNAGTLFQAIGQALLAGYPAETPAEIPVGIPHESGAATSLATLETIVGEFLAGHAGLCLLLDRFESLFEGQDPAASQVLAGNLRALRDAFKYDLTYVTASRRPVGEFTELAELFYAHTLWLGALNESDARWNVARYTERHDLVWDETTVQRILQHSGGYPSMLRAVCEAHADGCPLERERLSGHPAIRRRVEEFWADQPDESALQASGLLGHPLLADDRPISGFDTAQLTAKEMALWMYFQTHPDQVCEKDELIRAVWPEDRIFESGVRDDSLAQLVRRLREKIEQDPSAPRHIHTVTGRGYRFTH